MPRLKVNKDIDPPMGYSFVGLWDNVEGAHRWYAAAMKAKDKKPYFLRYNSKEKIYSLFVKKTKGEGKMVGRGFGAK